MQLLGIFHDADSSQRCAVTAALMVWWWWSAHPRQVTFSELAERHCYCTTVVSTSSEIFGTVASRDSSRVVVFSVKRRHWWHHWQSVLLIEIMIAKLQIVPHASSLRMAAARSWQGRMKNSAQVISGNVCVCVCVCVCVHACLCCWQRWNSFYTIFEKIRTNPWFFPITTGFIIYIIRTGINWKLYIGLVKAKASTVPSSVTVVNG